ncbi:MAG TPA: FAD binding domain-containing protein [Casimicrobiaceae bacterium]|nr:FAD binding domain-containing protein [Casimicrobiaceae bacterium]
MKHFEWTAPGTLAQALQSRARTTSSLMSASEPGSAGSAVLKAGGIDVLGLMKNGLLAPQRLVSLRNIVELRQIVERPNGEIAIGANATLAEVAAHPAIRQRYTALGQAVETSASPQLRNVATLAGNLLQRPRCWYFRSPAFRCARKGGDTCYAFSGENQYHAIFGQDGCAMVHPSTPATALAAWGASIEIASPPRGRRAVPIEAFFLAPAQSITRENTLANGDIVTAVVLPGSRPGMRSAHVRLGETDSFDWPLADVAVVLDLDADRVCRLARVVLGSAAPVPHRARAAEVVLRGRRIDAETLRRAAHEAVADATPLAHNAYKLPIFEALVGRAVSQAAQRT